MLPGFAKQTITRIRPGSKVSRGSAIPDWDNVSTLTIGGCSVQPGTTDLSQEGRVLGILDGLTCYLPEGADVQEGDRIEYDGNVYTIDGSPRRWQGAFNLSHVQINLRRWKG
jgi:hypothetical protein